MVEEEENKKKKKSDGVADVDENSFGVEFPIPKKVFYSEVKEERLTVNAHYGVSDEQYEDFVNKMLCGLIMKDTSTEVIDDFFSETDAETRVKVIAFCEAFAKYLRIYD